MVNDARLNKAQIKVTPTGGRASYEAAQVFSGIIRRIEYQSKAVDAYSTAIYHQVESGIGYVRVETDYTTPDSFDLDLFIRRIADPFTIYMDPDATEYDKADANFAFVFEDIPRDRYEDEHGKEDSPASVAFDNLDGWNDKDHVRIAEYWRRDFDTDTIHQMTDGTVLKDSEIPADRKAMIQPYIVKSRTVQTPTVEWFKISGDRIIDREEWPGKYIPIVPFIGEEIVMDNEMDRKGHTRSQIDAQRIYNYWASAAVEQVALQTKTPYVARADAIQGHEEQWITANTKNWSVMLYNGMDETGAPIPRPEREPPPAMAQAYITGMTIARNDLMSVTGQFQAEMGMPGNERSGTAIQQRQRQGDVATYHYIDNQSKGIRQVGRILLDMITKVYDTPRIVMMLGEDGSESKVLVAPQAPDAMQQVSPPTPPGQPGPDVAQPVTPGQAQAQTDNPNQPDPAIIFNPSVGIYDVEADVGASYGTQRQEAANAFSEIMKQNPAAFQIVGDFWAKNSDFPGADELADRLKRGLPPQYAAGPDPQLMALQQQSQQMQQQAHELLGKADQEIAELKQHNISLNDQLKDKSAEIAVKDYEAETRRLQAVGGIDPISLQVIVRQLVQDMLGTHLEPVLDRHAGIQGQLAGRMLPPPMNGAATAPPAAAEGAEGMNGAAPPPMAAGGALSAPAGMIGTMPPPAPPPGA